MLDFRGAMFSMAAALVLSIPAVARPKDPVIPTVPTTLEAESMETRTVGGLFNGAWNLWTNGYVENRVNFPTSGTYEVKVVAYGMLAGGLGPVMELRVDGAPVASRTLLEILPTTFTFQVTTSAGTHRIAIAYTNDAIIDGLDRNLLVDKASFAGPVQSPTPQPPPPPPPTTDEVHYPFGSHPMPYAAGTIRPSQWTQAQMDASVQKAYDVWKSQHVVQMCGDGRWVVTGGVPGELGYSEGQGYGMLLTVVMAGYDPQARTLFDGIFRFARDHGSVYSPYLMSWLINEDCTTAQPYPAPDGDLDMALALIMADRQWGSTGTINYLQEAKTTLAALKAKLVSPSNYIIAGPADLTRTSDMMLAHFRTFQQVTGDPTWGAIHDTCLGLLESVVSRYAPNTGLQPDFIQNANTSSPSPSPGGRLEGLNEGRYAWNACRNPWRLATEVAVSGDTRTKALVNKLVGFFETSSGGDPSRIYAVYNLNGSYEGYYNSVAFQAPLGAGAIVDASHQAFLDRLWAQLAQSNSSTYYEQSLQVFSMLVMSGNWWQP